MHQKGATFRQNAPNEKHMFQESMFKNVDIHEKTLKIVKAQSELSEVISEDNSWHTLNESSSPVGL